VPAGLLGARRPNPGESRGANNPFPWQQVQPSTPSPGSGAVCFKVMTRSVWTKAAGIRRQAFKNERRSTGLCTSGNYTVKTVMDVRADDEVKTIAFLN